MLFALILMVIHLVLLSLGGRLLKLSGAEIVIASNACILGPPMAAAMAVSKGSYSVTTLALLCGIFGYAIANFVGITLASFLLGVCSGVPHYPVRKGLR